METALGLANRRKRLQSNDLWNHVRSPWGGHGPAPAALCFTSPLPLRVAAPGTFWCQLLTPGLYTPPIWWPPRLCGGGLAGPPARRPGGLFVGRPAAGPPCVGAFCLTGCPSGGQLDLCPGGSTHAPSGWGGRTGNQRASSRPARPLGRTSISARMTLYWLPVPCRCGRPAVKRFVHPALV